VAVHPKKEYVSREKVLYNTHVGKTILTVEKFPTDGFQMLNIASVSQQL
jgi:hypothetical protein